MAVVVKFLDNLKTSWQQWRRSPEAETPEIIDVAAEPIETPPQKTSPKPWQRVIERFRPAQAQPAVTTLHDDLEEQVKANLREQDKTRIAQVFQRFAQGVTPADIEKIKAHLGEMRRGPIKDIWQKVQGLAQLIKDPNVAWRSKTMAIAALLYLVSPLDAVPDVIPFAGLADDAAVIIAVGSTLAFELEKYMTRQAEKKAEIEIKKHTTNVRITLLGSIAAAAIAILVKIILNILSS
ncbi:DUF1232 domain-containing protein [Picosynechococcus sp. PCC 11901]|nr:DUF1232 domain-containing protein [Picosynechococcus sp. PCC 11901]